MQDSFNGRSRASLSRRSDSASGRHITGYVLVRAGWLSVLCLCMFSAFPSSTYGQVSVLTHHNHSSRTGLNASETLLTPANVNSNQFGKLFAQNVDGFVVAEALYYPNVSIPGLGTHNVVYVVTQHDSVFAFDADTNQGSNATPLWTVSFIKPANGVTTVPISDQGCPNVTKFTEIGIMGTPVIDPATGTLYVVAKTLESGSYVFRLHALDVATGQEKFGGPVVISASVTGASGVVNFDNLHQMQRPGLLLLNGAVYLAFGSNGCDKYAHGWVLAYNASNLQQQVGVFNTTPDMNSPTTEGSIWQGGAGLAADSSGSIYFMTANGDFDANTGGSDFGDSFLRISLGGSGLAWTDYFTPYNQQTMADNDLDLGSGGPLLLPDQPGPNPHLLVGAGKTGTIYLVNRDNMGHFNSSSDQIVQELPNALQQEFFGIPAYWNNMVYFGTQSNPIEAFSLTNGLLSTTPVLQSSSIVWGANTPIISSKGASNGILWVVRTPGPTTGVLAAWDASKLGNRIYDSTQAGTRDTLGGIMRFITPTVANGRVYVGTQQQLVVYGLFPALSASAGNNQAGTVGTTLPVVLQVLASDPYSGDPYAGVTVAFSDRGKGGSFSNGTATTNSSGVATTTYTLPIKTGPIAITASSSGYARAQFSATANAGPPTTLTCTGSNQTATAGTPLPGPLRCKVKDSYGNAVSGVAVNFNDNGAGGEFSANSVTTNSFGNATVTYTTPTQVGKGKVKITITVTGLASLILFETVTAGSPASLRITSGNKQSAPAGTTLPHPLVVTVTDQYGNPVSGTTVSFSDGRAGGTLSAPSVTTNSSGQASVTYTLPGKSGPVSVTASVTGLTPVTFNETAQ